MGTIEPIDNLNTYKHAARELMRTELQDRLAESYRKGEQLQKQVEEAERKANESENRVEEIKVRLAATMTIVQQQATSVQQSNNAVSLSIFSSENSNLPERVESSVSTPQANEYRAFIIPSRQTWGNYFGFLAMITAAGFAIATITSLAVGTLDMSQATIHGAIGATAGAVIYVIYAWNPRRYQWKLL